MPPKDTIQKPLVGLFAPPEVFLFSKNIGTAAAQQFRQLNHNLFAFCSPLKGSLTSLIPSCLWQIE
jgi:hypothetical protein